MGTVSDGHHKGICLSAIAGRGRQVSLCVRYHPVLAAWLRGTCFSLGKTLKFLRFFSLWLFFVSGITEILFRLCPWSLAWLSFSWSVQGQIKGKQFKVQSSLLLGRAPYS